MKQVFWRLWCVAPLLGLVPGCGKPAIEAPETPPRPVKLSQAEAVGPRTTYTASGRIKARQRAELSFDRGDVHVLWSLMADDDFLTCVGLTYQGRRIEWPLLTRTPEPSATWTCFGVDTMADPSYSEQARITVFPQ